MSGSIFDILCGLPFAHYATHAQYESGLWKNLGLFLSSTSDICCAIDKVIEVPQEWIGEARTVGSVSGFVEAIVDLFVANSMGVREAAKQMAGEIALPHINLLINQLKGYVGIASLVFRSRH